MYGKKLRYVINFAFYWTILRLKGTLNASMMGSLEEENFCSGSAAPPMSTTLSTILQYVPVVLRFRQILKLFRMFFFVLMKSKMKTSSRRVPQKKPILLLRVQKAVNTNISKRLIKGLP